MAGTCPLAYSLMKCLASCCCRFSRYVLFLMKSNNLLDSVLKIAIDLTSPSEREFAFCILATGKNPDHSVHTPVSTGRCYLRLVLSTTAFAFRTVKLIDWKNEILRECGKVQIFRNDSKR